MAGRERRRRLLLAPSPENVPLHKRSAQDRDLANQMRLLHRCKSESMALPRKRYLVEVPNADSPRNLKTTTSPVFIRSDAPAKTDLRAATQTKNFAIATIAEKNRIRR